MEVVDPATLVFLDETSTQTVMTRRQGRAPKGERVVGAVPRKHGPNVTCLMAISPAAVLAPCVFAGAVNSILFKRWLAEWLLEAVPRPSPDVNPIEQIFAALTTRLRSVAGRRLDDLVGAIGTGSPSPRIVDNLHEDRSRTLDLSWNSTLAALTKALLANRG